RYRTAIRRPPGALIAIKDRLAHESCERFGSRMILSNWRGPPMFGKTEAQPQKRIDGLIPAGTVIRGDIVFGGGLRIDGNVEGSIATSNGNAGTLGVSEQAQVDGETTVSHVVGNGTVRGHST